MTFDLAKEFNRSEEQKEREARGVWLPITGGAKLLIARAGNENYVREYNRIPRATRRRIEEGRVSAESAEPVLAALIVNTVLLGWDGLTEDGKVVKYSKEKATEYLIKYPQFFTLVWELATEEENFHQEGVEEEVKN